MKNAICFGEVLWDVFPDQKKIGGAPLNVALRLNALGVFAKVCSAVGKDELGQEILHDLHQVGLPTDLIQQSEEHATGTVQVTLDVKGSASYTIKAPVAWDYIEETKAAHHAVQKADVFVYGSLASRNQRTQATLKALLSKAKFRVFDVNLRPPHYDHSLLEEWMQAADFIKFNDDELYEIAKQLGSPYQALDQHISYLAAHTNTPYICVTKGRHGAVFFTQGKFVYHSGYQVSIADTVGAGDSFLATLLEGILNQKPPEESLQRACAMGALVASKSGANPTITETELLRFIHRE